MSRSVYERLRELILDEQIVSSKMLVERALATRLGVSRTPVREALRRLEQDGLVERTGRGLRVTERTPEQVLELYEARIALEAAAARGAARRRTDLDLARLSIVHDEMRAFGAPQPDARVELNRRFHEYLWQACHNAVLVDVIRRLFMHPRAGRQSAVSVPGRWERILEEHQQLLDAIRERRAEDAERIAASHMTGARDAWLRLYARDPNSAAPGTDSSDNRSLLFGARPGGGAE